MKIALKQFDWVTPKIVLFIKCQKLLVRDEED
jgi:hypothetical protein